MNFVNLRLTEVKLLNIIFLTQIWQIFGPNILKIWNF